PPTSISCSNSAWTASSPTGPLSCCADWAASPAQGLPPGLPKPDKTRHTQGMSECPDYAALLAGHTDIIAMINAGEGGLPALNRLLGLAQRALGAAGLAFVERSRQTGRVIATVGAADWTLGRPVSVTHPASGGGPTDEATREFFADELFDERPEGPRDSRRHRVVVARAAVGDLIVGALHVYYSTSDSLAPEVHTVAAYLATCIAHMYGDQNGLPVHGDGPVVAALTDGLA